MDTINIEKTWKSVVTETHKTKPNETNLSERKVLLVQQVMLGQYELAKRKNNEKLIKFYADILNIYEKHI